MLFESSVASLGLLRLARQKFCCFGFSNAGISIVKHARMERMPQRGVSPEDLALVILRSQKAVLLKKKRKSFRVKLFGAGTNGDMLAVVLLVITKSENPETWIFKVVTVYEAELLPASVLNMGVES